MAMVIVLAAMLDVVWWVPAQERAAQERAAAEAPAIQVTTPRCRRAQLEREVRELQRELQRVNAQLAEIPAQ